MVYGNIYIYIYLEHFLIFPYIVIIPTDELIFFRGVETTNQCIYIYILTMVYKPTFTSLLRHHLVYPTIFHVFFWEVQPESAQVWLRIDDFVQLFDTVYECRLATGRRLGPGAPMHRTLVTSTTQMEISPKTFGLRVISSCFFSWIFTNC